MTMTRQHFEWIAEIIKTAPPNMLREQWAEQFASAMLAINPRFNRERFLRACGVEQ